ncbi:MAG: stage II sporulation protein M [Myxococcota bacterium]|jgi:uncharacterized membrane protein SpoIIM required for sporulation|nr:stage II sporulation protein M [Myxococcota bacterium]
MQPMELQRFIATRQARWDRLESLLRVAESSPPAELGRVRLLTLLHLYRIACSDLNQARAFTANAALLRRLNDLTGRGYRFLYRERPRGVSLAAVGRFFRWQVPAVFQQERRAVAAAAAALLIGATIGFSAVLMDPAYARDLVPAQFFADSPAARVHHIETSPERIASLQEAASFSADLYTNNIRVSFLAFALGALTLAGGVIYLIWTGSWLGAIAASYLLDEVGLFFFAWVGPHGALELPAIVFAGAAGLVAGHALLLPGELTRGSALRQAWPAVWTMMLATAAFLVLAGGIEGSFSQLSAQTVPYALKVGVALVLLGLLLAYLFWMRQRPRTGHP